MNKYLTPTWYSEINRLTDKLHRIAVLCEEEIESKGRFDSSQAVLEIIEVIHE